MDNAKKLAMLARGKMLQRHARPETLEKYGSGTMLDTDGADLGLKTVGMFGQGDVFLIVDDVSERAVEVEMGPVWEDFRKAMGGWLKQFGMSLPSDEENWQDHLFSQLADRVVKKQCENLDEMSRKATGG